jgi:hypothetical protein
LCIVLVNWLVRRWLTVSLWRLAITLVLLLGWFIVANATFNNI